MCFLFKRLYFLRYFFRGASSTLLHNPDKEASLFFLEATRVNKPTTPQFSFEDIKFNKIILQERFCLKKPNQDLINNALSYASTSNDFKVELTGFCDKKEYTYATFAPKTNKWSVSNDNVKSSKLLLEKTWVENNVNGFGNNNITLYL